MADILVQLGGWVAVMAIWAFLPIAAWHTWRDYRAVQQDGPRVTRIDRLAVGAAA